MKTSFLAAIAALFLAPAAGRAGDRFSEMDKDKNDRVTWQEFEAAMPQMRKSAFESIDTDKDGAISRTEWDVFKTSHGMKAKGMPPATMEASPDKEAMPLIRPPAAEEKTPEAKPGIMPPAGK